MGLGFGELVILLIIVLLVFGAGKLPQIGDALIISQLLEGADHDQKESRDECEVKRRRETNLECGDQHREEKQKRSN